MKFNQTNGGSEQMATEPIVCGVTGIQMVCASCGKWTWPGARVNRDGQYFHEACAK
jgi:hypothetical protein